MERLDSRFRGNDGSALRSEPNGIPESGLMSATWAFDLDRISASLYSLDTVVDSDQLSIHPTFIKETT